MFGKQSPKKMDMRMDNPNDSMTSFRPRVSSTPPEPAKKKRSKWFIVFILIVFILLAGSAAAAVYLYRENKKLMADRVEIDETKRIIEQVSGMIDVPGEEVPTMATVADKEKLKDQEFFANAENGDRLILYSSTKKAILFRPSTGKIINVSSINTAEPNTAQRSSEKTTVQLPQPEQAPESSTVEEPEE